MAHPIVFFDLETTGLIRDNGEDIPNIIQIGAVDSYGEKDPFMIHIVPGRAIEEKATEVTGYSTDSSFRELIHKDSNREIMAVDRETAFQAFMDCLDETFGESVLLVAHNCFNFDAKILLHNLKQCDIDFKKTIFGFSDSLLACRAMYGPPSHLAYMLKMVGIHKQQAHDAQEDAEDLRRMVKRVAAMNSRPFRRFVSNPRWCKELEDMIIYHTSRQQRQ